MAYRHAIFAMIAQRFIFKKQPYLVRAHPDCFIVEYKHKDISVIPTPFLALMATAVSLFLASLSDLYAYIHARLMLAFESCRAALFPSPCSTTVVRIRGI